LGGGQIFEIIRALGYLSILRLKMARWEIKLLAMKNIPNLAVNILYMG